ncbi:MAG: glycoside hydrolase family 1 protein [Solobacterium sp.]|nr:glycoside hydrolase family 1 protein [Solobacterium sp.]
MSEERFLIGSATAGGQVEGNNTNSDTWAQEYMKTGGYKEPSLDAADHYHTYRDDIRMMHEAGLNAYRFSFEWARIEPEKGRFDENEMNHYLDMVDACHEYDIEPVVTLLHFVCPKWLISEGGWEADTTPDFFARYVEYVAEHLKGKNIKYIVTINEANMGTLIAGYLEKILKHTDGAGLQIGMDLEKMAEQEAFAKEENLKVFGVENAAVFTSPRTAHGDEIVCTAHKKAVAVLHRILPETKVGLSLSVRDLQYTEGGKENADKDWEKDFLHYLPVIENDDFFGIQTYTRAIFSEKGEEDPAEGMPVTQMGYEYYPECAEHVIRRVHESFRGDLLITENGIATDDDTVRVKYIETAMNGVLKCREEGLPIKGYLYWSFIDNWEWQSGYSMQFGLVSLDREHQIHTPKPSLAFLGSYTKK